jgi:hypothetical protein
VTENESNEIRRYFDDWRNFQDENGIDLTLIDHMLSLTPTQRLEALEQMMAWDDELTRARVNFYGSDPRTALEAELGSG